MIKLCLIMTWCGAGTGGWNSSKLTGELFRKSLSHDLSHHSCYVRVGSNDPQNYYGKRPEELILHLRFLPRDQSQGCVRIGMDTKCNTTNHSCEAGLRERDDKNMYT